MNRDYRGSRRKQQPSHKPKPKRRNRKETKDSTVIDEQHPSGIGGQNIAAAVIPKSAREPNPQKVHSAQSPPYQRTQTFESTRGKESEKQSRISSGSSNANKLGQDKKNTTSVEVQTDSYEISDADIDANYYYRLVGFLVEVTPKVVRKYFEKICLQGKTFKIFLEENRHILFHTYETLKCCQCISTLYSRHSKHMSKQMFSVLYKHDQSKIVYSHVRKNNGRIEQLCMCSWDPHSNIDMTVLDISLANTLMKNCANMQQGAEDWLRHIVEIRNEIFHKSDIKVISKKDYENMWSTLSGSVGGLTNLISHDYHDSIKNEERNLQDRVIVRREMLQLEDLCREYWKQKCAEFEILRIKELEDFQEEVSKIPVLNTDNLGVSTLAKIVQLSSRIDDITVNVFGNDAFLQILESDNEDDLSEDKFETVPVLIHLDVPNNWNMLSIKEAIENIRQEMTTKFGKIRIKACSTGDLAFLADILKSLIRNEKILRSEINNLMTEILLMSEVKTTPKVNTMTELYTCTASESNTTGEVNTTSESNTTGEVNTTSESNTTGEVNTTSEEYTTQTKDVNISLSTKVYEIKRIKIDMKSEKSQPQIFDGLAMNNGNIVLLTKNANSIIEITIFDKHLSFITTISGYCDLKFIIPIKESGFAVHKSNQLKIVYNCRSNDKRNKSMDISPDIQAVTNLDYNLLFYKYPNVILKDLEGLKLKNIQVDVGKCNFLRATKEYIYVVHADIMRLSVYNFKGVNVNKLALPEVVCSCTIAKDGGLYAVCSSNHVLHITPGGPNYTYITSNFESMESINVINFNKKTGKLLICYSKCCITVYSIGTSQT